MVELLVRPCRWILDRMAPSFDLSDLQLTQAEIEEQLGYGRDEMGAEGGGNESC